MKDQPPFDIIGDEPIEARIVAWVLGEASAFEAAELERLCDERPELLIFRRRMRSLHGLLTEAESAQPDESWKLTPEKRKVLDEICGVENIVSIDAQKELRIRRNGRRAFLSIAACVTLTFIVIRMSPWKHEAEAIIEIKPRSTGMSTLGNGLADPSSSGSLSPQFFGTEFEKIKSTNSLSKVVDNLDLTNRWNVDKETAIKRLKGSIETKNLKGTDLIAIRVRDASERDAQEITQQVVQSYKTYRSEIENRDADKALFELNKAVRDQEDKVEERRKVLATIVRTKGIIYKGQDSFYGQSGVDEDQGGRNALQTYNQLEQEKMQISSQIDSLQKYDSDQLMAYAAGLQLPDNNIRAIHPQYLEAKRKLDSAKTQGLGDNHPAVKAAAEEVQATKLAMDEGVVNLRANLQAQLEMTTNRLKDVKVMKDDQREDAIKRGLDAQDYVDAKRDFETDQDLLQKLRLKQIGQMMNEKSTQESVIVHEMTPPLEPQKAITLPSSPIVSSKRDEVAANHESLKGGIDIVGGSSYALDVPKKGRERQQSLPITRGMVDDKIEGIEKRLNSIAENGKPEQPLSTTSPITPAVTAQPGAAEPTATPAPVAKSEPPQHRDGTYLLKSGTGSLTLQAGAKEAAKQNKLAVASARRAAEAKPLGLESNDALPDPAVADKVPLLADIPVIGRLHDVSGILESGKLAGLGGRSGGGAAFEESADGDERRNVAKPRVVPPAKGPQAMASSGPRFYSRNVGNRDDSSFGDRQLAIDGVAATAHSDGFKNLDEFATNAREELVDGRGQVEGEKAMKLRKSSGGAQPPVLQSKAKEQNKRLPAKPDEVATADQESEGIAISGANNYNGGTAVIAGTLGPMDTQTALTHGLRSGDQAINRNSIDAVLNNPNRVATGHNSAAGITGESDQNKGDKSMAMGRTAGKEGDFDGSVNFGAPIAASSIPEDKAPAADPFAAADHGGSHALLAHRGDQLQSDDSKLEGKMEDDPIRTNYALTYEHTQKVDQVRRNLYVAEGNFNLGKFDDSKKAYEDVLRTDPYNSAARRGLEKISSAKSDYYRATYDQTRAELLSQVDATWELSAPAVGDKKAEAGEVSKNEKSNRDFKFPAESEPPSVDTYWDTSSAVKPSDKDRSGGIEYDIHTGHQSEYLFRGVDLSKDAEPAPALVDLMEELSASETPYSTFSLNINDASFQLAKAALAKGERPDPAGIKTEQFYNAVDYGDPAPTAGEPVSGFVEQSAHPVIPGRNLVRVALRTASAGRSAAQPLRLTLLVDQSGSMVREDRRASMEHALSQLGVLLTKNDLVTVIGFSRTPRLLAENVTGDQAGKLSDLINQTASEGGTNLEEAMKIGGQKAIEHLLVGAQNRIVLFTDGAANLGDANPERLAEQVKAFRQKGLAFDIAGIGADGLNDRLLSDLARNGNGRYYVVGNEKNDSFARQLAGAFRPAAENVKVQVNFNPQRVGKYKLIGFEKDRLKTEDFRNDAVDAAELAADEAGVAIYQVEPLAEGTGELGEVSVRFRDATSKEMVERTWTMSYDAQASAFDRATPSMQLAGLALLAAEKLKGGPLADAIDFKHFTAPQATVKQFYGGSPRVGEMLRVIEKLK